MRSRNEPPEAGLITTVDLTDRDLWRFTALLLVVLFAASEAGRWAGGRVRHRNAPADSSSTALGFLTGGLFTLFAFILGIALSTASARLEARQNSVLNEANAIGTVWLRASLAGAPEGPEIRRQLRDYVRFRIAAVRDAVTEKDVADIVARTNAIQTTLWGQVESVAIRNSGPVTAQLETAMNDMIDLSLTNRRNFSSHIPPVVGWLMVIVSALAVGAMGYHFGLIGARHSVMTGLLLVVWTAAIVLVADIDNGRGGQVRVSAAPLIWTAEGFGPDK